MGTAVRVTLVLSLLGLSACSAIFGVDFDARPSPVASTDADAGETPDDDTTDPVSADASVRPSGGDGGPTNDAAVPDDPSDDGGPVVVPDSGPPLVNPVACKPDADGDGYPAPASKSVAFSNACPAGWTKYVTRKGDCDEANPNAHPGEIDFFGTARANGSYDYDCDGTEQKDFSITACSLALPTECSLYIQPEGPTACGQVQDFRRCVKLATGACGSGPSTFKAVVGCR